MSQTFKKREVERAIRKFNDTVTDLFACQFQAWGDTLTHLLFHCENDPVMRIITQPLRDNRNVDPKKWHGDLIGTVGGMTGSGTFSVPTDDEDRVALIYQFLLLMDQNEIDITRLCIGVFGISKYQEMVRVVNREIVLKFTREMSHRLQEIQQDIVSMEVVPQETVMVFNYHDNSRCGETTMNIHGNVQGSNVATGGSSISGSAATYNNNAELANALKALKPLVHDMTSSQQAMVNAALETLIHATEQQVPATQLQAAAATLAQASPTMRERLTEIAGKVGISLVASGIVLAIKFACGIP